MRTITRLVLVFAACLTWAARGEEGSVLQRWQTRFDIGGSIPQNPTLSKFSGPITAGDEMELSAGIQFDFAVGYRVLPWLTLEGELGFSNNEVDSVGDWSYPDSALSQMTMMFNVEFAYPRGPLVPFVGIGAGGVLSDLSFGNDYYYYWSESDGSGSDFVPAAQVFAGLRYEFNDHCSLGVTYRFLVTARQEWDVDWWTGADFKVGVDSVRMHSVCLAFTARF
jgi:opacity protein-like surface antigen